MQKRARPHTAHKSNLGMRSQGSAQRQRPQSAAPFSLKKRNFRVETADAILETEEDKPQMNVVIDDQ